MRRSWRQIEQELQEATAIAEPTAAAEAIKRISKLRICDRPGCRCRQVRLRRSHRHRRRHQQYRRSPLEELIRWRLWNRTGGGLMAELGSHQLDASGIFCTGHAQRRPEGPAADRSRPWAAARSFRWTASARITSTALRISRPRRTTKTRTRRSASPIRRSTATVSAATAKS